MGEFADLHIEQFINRRWGMPIPPAQAYASVSRADIAERQFKIVEVVGGRTNRLPGTKLVVTDKDDSNYHVWARKQVTGIAKSVCKTLGDDMALNEALKSLGRRPYGPTA